MLRFLGRPGRRTRRVSWLVSLVLVGALGLSACKLSRTYEVQGRVVGFGDDDRTVIVEHEDVPGLMPAMTMPFQVSDPRELEGLEQGRAVAFTLGLSRDSSWIYDVRLLPDDAVAAAPAGQEAPGAAPGGVPVLHEGDAVPPFQLVSQDGEPVRFSDYAGQALLVTFIYTRCPLPDFCPRMSGHFQQLQARLQPRFGDRVQLLSVSFDPEYDTPEVLRAYAADYTDDTEQWTFATGTPEQVERVAHLFGVFYADESEDINHNLRTTLVGPEGHVRQIWSGNAWTPEEVLEAVARVLPDAGRAAPEAS